MARHSFWTIAVTVALLLSTSSCHDGLVDLAAKPDADTQSGHHSTSSSQAFPASSQQDLDPRELKTSTSVVNPLPTTIVQVGLPRSATTLQFFLLCAAVTVKVLDHPKATVDCLYVGAGSDGLAKLVQPRGPHNYFVLKTHGSVDEKAVRSHGKFNHGCAVWLTGCLGMSGLRCLDRSLLPDLSTERM